MEPHGHAPNSIGSAEAGRPRKHARVARRLVRVCAPAPAALSYMPWPPAGMSAMFVIAPTPRDAMPTVMPDVPFLHGASGKPPQSAQGPSGHRPITSRSRS
jgi:hypothetical protein